MADEDEDLDDAEESEEDSDEEGDDSSSGGKGGKKVLIIIGVVILLVVGGIGAAYFTGLLDPVIAMIIGEEEMQTEEQQIVSSADAVFYDLQEIVVNLNTSGRKSSFLKIRISLELSSEEDVLRIESVMPRIVDNFQTYLRELRIDDLKGSSGMYRLREELLARVSAAAAPTIVNDVLFKEMLVQ